MNTTSDWFGSSSIDLGFEHEVTETTAPESVTAGTRSRIHLRVRNDSTIPWRQRDVLPVLPGYRLMSEDLELATVHSLLPSDVAPGEEVDLELEVQWPEAPGEYQLIVDLALHPVGWFAEKTGEPLLSQSVTVEAEP
jgi:hypothetical protein